MTPIPATSHSAAVSNVDHADGGGTADGADGAGGADSPAAGGAGQMLAAAGFAAGTVAVAGLGSLATSAGMDWYDELERPAFTPPDATFGIVWTVLYITVATAGWLAWRASSTWRPTIAWAVQMGLNLAWTVVFFGMRSPEAALAVIAALIVAVGVDIRESARVHRVAGALLGPYLLWCGFAAALNLGIVVLN